MQSLRTGLLSVRQKRTRGGRGFKFGLGLRMFCLGGRGLAGTTGAAAGGAPRAPRTPSTLVEVADGTASTGGAAGSELILCRLSRFDYK